MLLWGLFSGKTAYEESCELTGRNDDVTLGFLISKSTKCMHEHYACKLQW